MRALLILGAALLLVATACEKRGADATAAQQEPGQQEPGRPGDLEQKLGSPAEKAPSKAAAEFCQEHGVLEAVCTKCNPKLIPVFQAKGDWCAEHGLPESFCPICHPERGGKPASNVTDDGAPADGTKIRFKTLEVARRAGLETRRAVEYQDEAQVVAVARLTYDATRVALVNARAPGVVTRVKVDIGSQVKPGMVLAVIQSAQVGADRARLKAARARVEVTEASYTREQALQVKGIASDKEVQAARQEWELAKAEVTVLSASLGMVGGTEQSTQQGSGGGVSTYSLTAPSPGTITQREASVGMLVDTDQALFTLVDTSTLWAEIDVPESDIGLVKLGQAATFAFDSVDSQEITGAVDYIAPELDPRTRTVLVRVQLSNSSGLLRANLYGQARIAVGGLQSSVMVPRAALQRTKGKDMVFIRIKEDEYEARRVTVRTGDEERVIITRGIRANEEVVTTGSFLLKTETLKGSIGAGCCDVD